jgi:P-type conjugative transfer protein TrbJ
MNRRDLGVGAAFAAVVLARPAQAQVAVADAANLAQSTITAAKTAQNVLNTLQQIEMMKIQLQYQLQTLRGLDPRSFSDLQRLLGDGTLPYQMIRGDVDSLGFQIQDVNRNFDSLFPKNDAGWRNVRYADYDSFYGRWNAEITASSKSAAHAQSTIVLVERDNLETQQILSRSATATGEVRQLQLINQQLALIHGELGSLVQNLATMGRVTGDMASASAGEKMLTREAKLRRRAGYTDRGRAPKVLTRLP